MRSSTLEFGSANVASAQRPWALRVPVRIAAPVLVLSVVVGIGFLAPQLTPYDPEVIDPTARLAPSSTAHLLGTDEFGRDVLSRLAYGARVTLIISTASVTIATLTGTLLGMLAAYFGGSADLVAMRVVDGLLSFPPILLALFVITFLGPSLVNVILVIGLLYMPRFARVAHGATLTVRQVEYVEAARALGATHTRVLRRAILPNIAAPLLVQGSLAMGHAILLESGLSFLGLGAPPPAPSWGRMIEQSSRFMGLSPWPVLWPAVTVSMTVLALNLLGDALRDYLDPRLRRLS